MENRVTFIVTGLSAAGAQEKIREKLYGVSGVDTVDFNQDKNQLVICGMELERAIWRIGFAIWDLKCWKDSRITFPLQAIVKLQKVRYNT